MEYDKKTFRKYAVAGGYAKSATCTLYFKQNPKPFYDDSDFVEVYRLENNFSSISRKPKKRG